MNRINGNRLPRPILYFLPILLLRGLCVKRKGGTRRRYERDDTLKSFEPGGAPVPENSGGIKVNPPIEMGD